MSPELLATAEQIGNAYASVPHLTMAVVTGSVARGIADAASDLDVYLFWNHVDVAQLAATAYAEPVIGQRLLGFPTETGFFEKYRFGDRLVDVESVTVDTLAAVERSLARVEPMSPLVAKTLAGVRDAVPLVGAAALDGWRARLAYTPEQALVEIGVNLRRFLPPVALHQLTAARGDIISYAARLSTVALAAVGAVAALNEYALPLEDPKWLPWHVARMRLQPPDFLARLEQPLAHIESPDLDGFTSALQDALDLIERERPAARGEVARAKYVLAFPPDVP